MKSRRAIFGCLTILIILLLAAGAALFWFDNPLNPRSPALAEDAPTLFVDILSPESAETLTVGQPVQVLVQTWSLAPLDRLELLVNGDVIVQEGSIGVAKPLQTTLPWQVGGAGVHTLVARATDLQGQVEESQTLILNVAALPFTEGVVGEGISLESISQENGTTVPEVVALNPGLDPGVPLQAGQSIVLPSPNNSPPPSQHLADPNIQSHAGVDMLIQWALTTFEPVNQSYCYQTTDGQNWQRTPAQNFNFYSGNQWLQPILLPPTTATVTLALDCWAWKIGVLTYLGQAQTQVAVDNPPEELTLEASGFIAQGLPVITTLADKPQAPVKVPPPFSLREPASVTECAEHFGNALALLVCEGLMNAPRQDYYTLIWEWQPKRCLLKGCPNWVDEIAGYQLFEFGLINPTFKYVKEIKPGQQVTAISVPPTPVCYLLRAYAENPPDIPYTTSEAVTFCPTPPLPSQKLIVSPDDWFSMDDTWVVSNGCGGDGPHPSNFVPQGTQVLAGYIKVDLDNCYKESQATAIVQFPDVNLPSGAIIQRVELQFVREGLMYRRGSNVATNAKPLCVTRLVAAQQPWVNPYADHFVYGTNTFTKLTKDAPYQQDFVHSSGGDYTVDVTAVVTGWHQKPETNHGFIFHSSSIDLFNSNVFSHGADISVCYTTLNQIQLVVEYFVP